MKADGTQLIRLTDDPAADSNPSWSPDGTRIAFISRRDGFANLYVMNTDGSNVVQLTTYQSIVEVPAWSFDSRMIVFASDMHGNRELYALSADGSNLNRLTDSPAEEFYPAWSPEDSFLSGILPQPTTHPEAVCVNAEDPAYGFSPENPVRIGYDPRVEGDDEHQCLPWLLGPQGETLKTELIEQISSSEELLCVVAVSYQGKEKPDIMYFDIYNYEQPLAPIGYSCGSPYEYLRALSAAQLQ